MLHNTDDIRISQIKPLLPPAILMEELPLDDDAAATVEDGRRQIQDVLEGRDRRLVVVAGPCSIHDPRAAREYAGLLHAQARRLADDLIVVMRVYFEKPRTTTGWKGLINDPDLDGRFAINRGLRQARGLLVDLARLGLPAGTEFLDTITPQFIADLVAWGAIGARTTESQIHRELASGLSMPVGFKNGTGGSVQIAVDAMRAARHPHHFLSVTKQGISAIVETGGNPYCHVILRGSTQGPNHGAEAVEAAGAVLHKAGLAPHLMVDCSHGNSLKDHARQPAVADELARQVAGGQEAVFGVMLESNLVEGRQDIGDAASLRHGQSVTDACIGWDATVEVLEHLAGASRRRLQKKTS